MPMPNRSRVWLLLLIATLVLPVLSQAEFYRYTTDDGDVYYVDDLTRVPEAYRDQIKVYREPGDYLSDSEKQRLRQMEQTRQAEALAEQKRAAEAEKEAVQSRETRVQIIANQVLVPVTIGHNYQEYDTFLLLDTGATNIVLHTAFANAVNIRLRHKNVSRLAGGGLIPTESAQIDSLKIGPYTFNDLNVTIINYSGQSVPYSGLLGMNVLRQTKYSIDFDNSVIRWQPE